MDGRLIHTPHFGSCVATKHGVCHVVGALSTGNMSYIHYLNSACATIQAHYRLGALSRMQWRTEAKFVSESLSHARQQCSCP
jgi:hypothetical protein